MLQHKCLIFETNQHLYMKRLLLIIICLFCITTSFAQREVLYNVDLAKFSDSNGDGHGDIKGLRQKLNDLQSLGITTIVISPVYESDADGAAIGELEKINPKYGNFKEYRDLIHEVHNRKMKLYQTINLQYVNSANLWFKDSYKNTKSVYSDYVYYTDSKNEKPVNGTAATVAVNLKNAKVADYYKKALKYWTDPDGNGVFYDGADGFVFKPVQDKVDAAGKNVNLFKEFWEPLSIHLKKINPGVQIITDAVETKAFRYSLYTKAGADGVPAQKLQEAITALNKSKIIIAADSTFNALPAGKYPILELENERTDRLASISKTNIGKLKVQAGLNLLIGGVPMLYYGQDLGTAGYNQYTESEASLLIEQQKDKNSLWNYYKELIKIKAHPALALGIYKNIHNSNDEVVSFLRKHTDAETGTQYKVFVMINLSSEKQFVTVDRDKDITLSKLRLYFGTPNITFPKGGSSINMTPYSVQVWMLP